MRRKIGKENKSKNETEERVQNIMIMSSNTKMKLRARIPSIR